jgi:AmiR/NasT family two-component response regulator
MQNEPRSNGGSGGAESGNELHQLQVKVAQLEQALESRMIIEQAKGAVSARCEVPIDVAFELIRGMARSRRRKLHELCAELVAHGGRFAADPRSRRSDGNGTD